MAGHKTFVNQTGNRLAVTLFIRAGTSGEPSRYAGLQPDAQRVRT